VSIRVDPWFKIGVPASCSIPRFISQTGCPGPTSICLSGASTSQHSFTLALLGNQAHFSKRMICLYRQGPDSRPASDCFEFLDIRHGANLASHGEFTQDCFTGSSGDLGSPDTGCMTRIFTQWVLTGFSHKEYLVIPSDCPSPLRACAKINSDSPEDGGCNSTPEGRSAFVG